MRLDELNWMDVEAYLKQDDRLILITGACEEHGYLSLLTDIKIPQALADAVSLKTGVLIAPPLNFGVSPYFVTYPGTISLRVSTFISVIEDMLRSVYRQGFRRLLVLNGHGGNASGKGRIVELLDELPGLQVRWYEWWAAESVTETAKKHGLKSFHAAWIEAFKFVRVAPLPGGKKREITNPDLLGPAAERELVGDGVFGGPYQVDENIMDEIFSTALADILDLLTFKL